jgi:hypothetical protein
MHIIQRLLLPSVARQQQNYNEVTNATDADTDQENPNSAINDNFMNTISQMNNAEDQNHNLNIDDDGMADDDIDNPMNHLFQCDWSERPIHALELLLSQLEGNMEQPYLLQYKFPVGYDTLLCEVNDGLASDSDKYDAKLSCAHHAAEILIGIIQNSPLSSSVMIALSSEQFLGRIIQLTLLSGESNEVQTLVPYESIMTCAMTVLEHLILQLGGYGTATTQAAPGSSSGAKSPSSPVKATDTSFSLSELGPHTPATSPAHVDVCPSIATTAALIRYLPQLLEDLSSLLVHPATKDWSAPKQYTNFKPRPILGTVRIRIIRLLESLVLLGDPMADLILQQSDCLECCLDLFWEFEWCSMLHQSVANLLVHVFEAGDHRAGLQDYFVVRCQLLEKLMDSFSNCASAPGKLIESNDVKINGVKEEAKHTELGNELVMAMKPMYTDHISSSTESLDGSGSDNSSGREQMVDVDDSDAIAHVSEDDVESAMEKEEQESQALKANVENNVASEAAFLEKSAATTEPPSANDIKLFSFRRGYMGHVIIICQALVNACNANSKDVRQINLTCEIQEEESLNGDTIINNTSSTADFESSAVHLLSEESPPFSRKRMDTSSPIRILDDDSPVISPIAKILSSPTEVESLAQSPLECHSRQDVNSLPHISLTIQQHPLAQKWNSFVSTTLASEMKLQASPLGGQHIPKDMAAGVDPESSSRIVSLITDDSDTDFVGGGRGVFGIIDGDFDMNDAEIDIAAEMMESLNLNTTNKGTQQVSFGEDGSSNRPERNIGNFGSLIHSSNAIESKGYVYDDPLGCVCAFENDDSSDEDDGDTMKKPASLSKEENGVGSLNKSSSTDEEDEDDMAPVLDLFTGNFSENFSGETSQSQRENSHSNEYGWANFADFEGAFDDATKS